MPDPKRSSPRKKEEQQRRGRRPQNGESSGGAKLAPVVMVAVFLCSVAAVIYIFYPADTEQPVAENAPSDPASDKNTKDADSQQLPIGHSRKNQRLRGNPNAVSLQWGHLPDPIKPKLVQTSTKSSNIHPSDYAGPASCKECHKKNFDDWSQHAHRRMNAFATEANVVGDFSGNAKISYKGGEGTFYRENGEFRMRYQRGDLLREYQINQTIGSRFFQYYVGKGLKGPEPAGHEYYRHDHVLPFGYWIDRQVWVPIVHVHEELPDDERWEPAFFVHFSAAASSDDSPHAQAPSSARGVTIIGNEPVSLRYATSCNFCHTTFPLADMFLRMKETKSEFMPNTGYFWMSRYLADAHPDLWDGSRDVYSIERDEIVGMVDTMRQFDAPSKAITLGISCEACHLGCKAHAEDEATLPPFVAKSPHLYTTKDQLPIEQGRTHKNLTWVCSRCHNGKRPTYAGGISTWNSTEFTDATRGSCYSELTCVNCHNPHKTIGKKWTQTPEQDDASCLKCHEKYNDPAARQNHTHHPARSSGDRCMNCHMPKINEGMQDVVRTHTIFSPTQTAMIQANHPNACNLCHLDQPIDWTLEHLKSWYGREYSEKEIAANYPQRKKPVGLGWLKHSHEAVRLVAADALAHAEADWALPDLVDMLDDDYLLNRQFTQDGLEHKLGIKLDEKFGYWFYMTKEERQQPIQRIRAGLSKDGN